MGIDFSIRPVGAPVAAPVVHPASEAAHEAVATQLPASQSVTAADANARIRNDPGPGGSSLSHQAFFDRDAASIVYQVVDNRTNLVVQQLPDERSLRRRAYARAIELTRGTPTRVQATDRKA